MKRDNILQRQTIYYQATDTHLTSVQTNNKVVLQPDLHLAATPPYKHCVMQTSVWISVKILTFLTLHNDKTVVTFTPRLRLVNLFSCLTEYFNVPFHTDFLERFVKSWNGTVEDIDW